LVLLVDGKVFISAEFEIGEGEMVIAKFGSDNAPKFIKKGFLLNGFGEATLSPSVPQILSKGLSLLATLGCVVEVSDRRNDFRLDLFVEPGTSTHDGGV
jgi:hypothetical protein